MTVPGMTEDFDRLITAEAAGTLQTFLAEIINGTTNYKTVHSLTQQVEHQYHGRFFVELLQNAHDAMEDSYGRVAVSLLPDEGDYGCLYIANDGRPFEHNNFQSLARLGQSSKDPNDAIGNKGIGFRSVLEICIAPEIYSRAHQTSDGFDGYCFRFSPAILTDLARALARLAVPTSEARLDLGDTVIPLRWPADDRAVFWKHVKAKSEGWLAAELTFLSPYSIPLPIHRATFVEKIRTLESQSYASVVRLPLKSGKARDMVVQVLKAFSPRNLLFLERLDELTVELGRERRVFKRRSQSLGMPFDGQRITLSSKEEEFSYRVWSTDIGGEDDPEGVERLREAVRELPGKWPELSRARVSIAVLVGPTPEAGVISIFLPSQIKTGIATHVNGPFFADMSRTNVNFVEPLNTLLLDVAVSMAAELIMRHLQGKVMEEARVVVDLLSGPGHSSGGDIDLPGRIADVIEREYGRVSSRPILLTDRGWCAPEAVRLLPRVDTCAFFTERRLRELAPFPIVSGELAGRVAGVTTVLERFGGEHRGRVTERELAAVIEAGAESVRVASQPAGWRAFWMDVMTLLPDGLAPLQECRVLLGVDGALHAGMEEAPVFFPPGHGDDEDDDDASEAIAVVRDIPAMLQGKLAFLSEQVPTHGVGEQGRRYRMPLYSALNAARLVTTFRAENIVRSSLLPTIPALPAALNGDQDMRLRELLRWALTLYVQRRPAAVTRLMSALPLPCAGGWFPAAECSFGPGWEGTTGHDLATFLHGLESTACCQARQRLLLPLSDERWHDVPASIETLMALGVCDGLRLAVLEPDTWISKLSVVWYKGEKFLSLPEEPPPGYTKALWSHYREACSRRQSPSYQSGYRFDSLLTLPGLDLLTMMPRENRLAFTTVLLHSMPTWPAQWRVTRVHRPQGYSDTREMESPIAFALRQIDWLTFQSEGEIIAARPSERWFVPLQVLAGQVHHFRHLLPLPLELARRIEALPEARQALHNLGMPVYEPDQPMTDTRLLDDLARAWSERRELVRNRDVFVGQVRAAWERFKPTESTTKPRRLVIMRGDGDIDVMGADVANPIYVPNANEVVNSALRLMAVPVLLIDSRDAKNLSPQVKAWYGQAVVNASALTVRPFAGGTLLRDTFGDATLLHADEQLGWLPAVVLTLAAFQSDRSHGTGTRGFREGMRRLRSVRILRVPHLELGVIRVGQAIYRLPVPSVWVQDKQILLIDEDAERRSLAALSGTLRTVLDRADRELELALKLVLDRLATAQPPTESQIVEALDTVNITRHQFGEVMQHWTGEQQWLVERLRPIILLLLGGEGLRHFDEHTPDANRQLALESTLQMIGLTTPEPIWLLELVRRGKTMLDIGHELYAAIGPEAELERWNRTLSELGFTSVVNPDSHDQFEAHLRAALTPLRSVLRSVVARTPATHSFRILERALGQLTPSTAAATQYWELPFSETMKVVANHVEAQGATEAEVQALKRVLSLEELYIALDELGLEPRLDPGEIYVANERELVSVCALMRSAAIVWSERNEQPVPHWVEDQQLGAASLERLGFIRRLDKDEWFQQLRHTLRLQHGGVLADALLTATSIEALLQSLALTENDLGNAEAHLKSMHERALRAQRTINVCGQPFENEAANLTNLPLHIVQCIPTVSPGAFDLAIPAPLDALKGRGSGRKAHGGGPQRPRRKRDHAKEVLAGIVGEMHAFRMLQAQYGAEAVPPSMWRSECSEYWFPGNGGDDLLGYDFALRLGNTRYFIEVKSSEGEPEDFELGSSEVAKAMEVVNKKRTRFVILRVLYALSTEPTFEVLPNPYEPSTQGLYSIEEGGLRVRYRRSRA